MLSEAEASLPVAIFVPRKTTGPAHAAPTQIYLSQPRSGGRRSKPAQTPKGERKPMTQSLLKPEPCRTIPARRPWKSGPLGPRRESPKRGFSPGTFPHPHVTSDLAHKNQKADHRQGDSGTRTDCSKTRNFFVSKILPVTA